MTALPRRTFMGSIAAGLAFTIVPRRVLGRGYRAPSDTLNVACIGVGGMGWQDVRGVSGENIVALCDVDLKRSEDAFGGHPEARRYRDFRVMLEREMRNIDAVTVSTPDHTHAVAAMMALRMGKHVYVQKPLARTIHEVHTLAAESARRQRLATQMGNQGHAGEGTRQIREWVEAGAIGTVREVHYWTNRPIWPQAIERPTEMHHVPQHLDWNLWLGPAADRPYHPAYAPFRWRGWWDFGTGALGDIACHAMDAAFWVLGLGHPSRVEPENTTMFPETAPRASRVLYEFPERGTRPAVRLVWRDGGITPPRPPEVSADAKWPPSDEGGQLWIGTDGKLAAGIYGQNPRLLDADRDAEIRKNPPPVTYPRVENVYAEWIAACKDGTQPGSNFVGHAGPLTEMVLLGCIAVRMGRVLEVDPVTGRIVSPTVPDEYVRSEYRRGWEL